MDSGALIRNVGGSILHSEDDLDDTNPTNQIVPNIIKNIPSDSPWSSLTECQDFRPQIWAVLELPNPDQNHLKMLKKMDLF